MPPRRGVCAPAGSARGPARSDEPALVGEDHELRPVAHLELDHGPAHVGLGRRRAEHQAPRDLVVAEPLADQGDHLALTLGQHPEPACCRGVGGAAACGELADEPAGDPRAEEGVTGGDGPHAAQQLRGLGVLDQEAARPDPDRVEDVLVEVERRQDDGPGGGEGRVVHDLPGRRQAVTTGHADVHEHHVGSGGAHDADGLRPAGGLPHDLEVVLGVEEGTDTGAQQRLVVGQHHPGHCPSPVGRVSSTLSPPIGEGPMTRVPPRAAARSCIPRSPLPCSSCASPTAARPSSSTRTVSSPAPYPSATTARRACACRTTLVIASWTTRQAASSTAAGNERTCPSTVFVTSRPAWALRSTMSSTVASVGAGARGALVRSSRSTSMSDRSSPRASLLASLIARSAGSTFSGRRSARCSATPACTLMSERWWATTSCSSRAICSRSSPACRRRRSCAAWRKEAARSARTRTTSATERTTTAQPDTTSSGAHHAPSAPDRTWVMASAARRAPAATHAVSRWPRSTVATSTTATLANTGP